MNNIIRTQLVTVAAILVFSAIMITVGITSYKKTKTIDGFLLGGRKIGAWVSAFSYGTAYFSAVIFVGYAGKHGWSIGMGSIWIGIGNALIGCYLSWRLFAKRTRNMTHTLSAKTMPEFFELRYKSTLFKVLSALIIFIFLVPYSAAVYKGLGSMFNTIFPNVSVNVCMAIIAVLASIYLFLGGYVATAYTDFIQGIIMVFGVFAMVIAILYNGAVGGLAESIKRLHAIDPQLVSITGGSSFKFLCTNILLTSFGTWGLPQMIGKFYAIKDEGAIKKATVVSTGFCMIIGFGAYFVGSLSRLILNNELPLTAAGAADYDSVVPKMLVTALGNSGIFTSVILAVILLLLLSASMSTLASIVLTSSSAISVDLMSVIKKDKNTHQVGKTRILCILFVFLSYLFATMNFSFIVNIMSFSWGIVSGCFVGPYVWGICSKKITRTGAWAGMICGFLTVAVPTLILSITGGFPSAVSKAPELGVFAMAASALVTPAVSLFTKKFDVKFVSEVFSGRKEDAA